MFKKFARGIGLGILLAVTASSIALADVPNPWGRGPRPQPPKLMNVFRIVRSSYNYNHDANNVAIEFGYISPEFGEVTYKALKRDGTLLAEGKDMCMGNSHFFTIVLPKAPVGESYWVKVRAHCEVNKIETAFGIKELDQPSYKGDWSGNYIVETSAEGESKCGPAK